MLSIKVISSVNYIIDIPVWDNTAITTMPSVYKYRNPGGENHNLAPKDRTNDEWLRRCKRSGCKRSGMPQGWASEIRLAPQSGQLRFGWHHSLTQLRLDCVQIRLFYEFDSVRTKPGAGGDQTRTQSPDRPAERETQSPVRRRPQGAPGAGCGPREPFHPGGAESKCSVHGAPPASQARAQPNDGRRKFRRRVTPARHDAMYGRRLSTLNVRAVVSEHLLC